MTTQKIYKLLDNKFTFVLRQHNLAYNLRKERNVLYWRVQIGKFNKITDSYIQSGIEGYGVCGTIEKQFEEILSRAIIDKLVNY